jgi:hypothetical protein
MSVKGYIGFKVVFELSAFGTKGIDDSYSYSTYATIKQGR